MASGDLDYSVTAALRGMELTEPFVTFVKAHRDLWLTFGTMNSHLHRKKLMKLMDAAKLTKEQRLVVHFLFAVVKNKSRVMDGLASMPDSVKTFAWYEPVRTFIAGNIVDYNSAAKASEKFPGTHIGITNPGLDMLMWRIMTPKAERSLDRFFIRTTSIQLKLDKETQEMAKSGYKLYWDTVVVGTRNTTATEEAKFRENYYNTSAGDMYLLVDDNLKEFPPKVEAKGYTREEIEKWIAIGD
jgi:hypothetical protein